MTIENIFLCGGAERTFIGHHERLPQCADLLRKPWRFIAEIPYLPLITPPPQPQSREQVSRDIDFVFVGRVHLWSISRACAVRPWLVRELAGRHSTELIDISEDLAHGAPVADEQAQWRGRFCLIARADSYSTAAFYNAIQAGCVPVVISDWFVFSFWWAIPYDAFVIRIPEDLFVTNPNEVLDEVLRQHDETRVRAMQREMRRWRSMLRFEGGGGGALELMMAEMKAASLELAAAASPPSDVAGKKQSKKRKDSHKGGNVVAADNVVLTCFDPILCASRRGPAPLVVSGRTVKNVFPYLCQHAARLLGRYKIVYFQKCVKLLWPLRPGNILKQDRQRGISAEEELFVRVFHNISGAASAAQPWLVYPPLPGVETDMNTHLHSNIHIAVE